MSEEVEPNEPASSPWSHHPLVVLAVGGIFSMLFTIFIVPKFQEGSIKLKREEDARARYERELYQFDTEINTSLNSLITSFEFALKMELLKGGSPELRDDYLQKTIAKYETFDSIAWWKMWNLNSEVENSLDLDAKTHSQLNALTKDYQNTLTARTQLLEPAWSLFEAEGKGGDGVIITNEWFDQMKSDHGKEAAKGRKIVREMLKTALANR